MSKYNTEPKTLQEAYLSIIKKSPQSPSSEYNKPVSTSPVREIAPGLKIKTLSSHEDEDESNPPCEMCGDDVCGCSTEEGNTTGYPLSMEVVDGDSHHMEGDKRFSTNDEDEEDDMTVDNVHSIRDSLLKISIAVASGVHLEPWQQSKLSVVMDNLAEIARRLPRQMKDC